MIEYIVKIPNVSRIQVLLMIVWCNGQGYSLYNTPTSPYKVQYEEAIFSFMDEVEAMAFKLRWL